MFTQVARAYFKPLLLITSLNAAVVGLTVITWHAMESAGAEKRPAATVQAESNSNPCVRRDGNLTPESPLVLKERAERVFEVEHGKTAQDRSFLLALSTALKFQEYAQVEHLLNEYECGHRL